MDLRESTAGETGRIQQTARALARIDALASLAQAAVENNYCRPVMTENIELCVKEGRHPVVEKTLKPGEFTPNDTDFNDEKGLVILTGPNMSGKSTYIRQVALMTIMAQSGGFVPAEKATIGVTDRVFTRIGASDEIARGQSTFMVEMNETALILNNATEKSLIILDEVGRGTSTLDGLSIARAVAENIHNKIGARTLFATHYHELTELARDLPRAVNYNVAVREWGDEVVFLHKIEPGETDKSYGIHVARLAGVPEDVIDRAKDILQGLETKVLDSSAETEESEDKGQTQLPLFKIQ
jgi:DNA mismatch repair protein MutS